MRRFMWIAFSWPLKWIWIKNWHSPKTRRTQCLITIDACAMCTSANNFWFIRAKWREKNNNPKNRFWALILREKILTFHTCDCETWNSNLIENVGYVRYSQHVVNFASHQFLRVQFVLWSASTALRQLIFRQTLRLKYDTCNNALQMWFICFDYFNCLFFTTTSLWTTAITKYFDVELSNWESLGTAYVRTRRFFVFVVVVVVVAVVRLHCCCFSRL